jgi:UDP-glucose 4-epimerase
VDSLLYHVRYGTYEVNLMGSLNLISASIRTGVRCILFASSTAVYGRHVSGVAREDATPTHPEDSESIAKLAVEQELGLAQKMFGLDHVIFRIHHVCGARQRLEDTQDHAIGRFVTQALQQMPMTPADDDAAIVSFADARDVAARLVEAPEVAAARNQTFNIGADYTCSERELAMAVAQAVGGEARVANAPALVKHHALQISQERLESVFGHRPKHHLADTLMTLVTWVETESRGQPREVGRSAVWAIRQ